MKFFDMFNVLFSTREVSCSHYDDLGDTKSE